MINCEKAISDKFNYSPALRMAEKKPVNVLGIVGFVISFLSIYFGVFYCIASILGLILSAVAYARRGKHSLNGLALEGLVIGMLTLLFYGMIWLTGF